MNDILVSIIIPTHKGADKISRAVESAISQTYSNIEIIVVDDNGAGTDEQISTEKVLAKYLPKDNITYLVHNMNKNGSAARNTGIKASKGDYIVFLDDDDIFLPKCIEKEVELFKTLPNDYGIIFSSFFQEQEKMVGQVFEANFKGEILFDFLMGRIQSPSSILMIKRSVVEDIGYWDETFWRHQDWEYIARILTKYKAAGLKDICVHRYILGRHSAKLPEVYEKQRLHFIEEVKPIIDSLPEHQRKMVYDRHYIEIGKAYFKNRQLFKSIYWARRTNQPIKVFKCYFNSGITYFKKRLKYFYTKG